MTARSVTAWITLWGATLAGCPSSDLTRSGNSSTTQDVGEAFLSSPPSWVRAGDTFVYRPLLDASLAQASLELTQAPASVSYDSDLGVVWWSPNDGDVGMHDIQLSASTGARSYVQSFTLTVIAPAALGSQSLGTSGGSLVAGPVAIEVPAGALDGTAALSVSSLSLPSDVLASADVELLGDAIQIDVRDAAGNPVEGFGADVRATLAYDPASLPPDASPSNLTVYLIDPDLEGGGAAAESSSVDAASHTVSFTTPHLSVWGLGLFNRLAYTELASDDTVSVEYADDLLKTAGTAAATAYCQSLLAATQAAKSLATAAGFKVPAKTEIRVYHPKNGSGTYSSLSGVTYVTDKMNDAHLKATAAHEFFHQVQHQYYSMNAEKITRLNWWFESTAPWFESKVWDGALAEKIGASLRGYLRVPLTDRQRENAYGKATFIAYAESRVPGIVRRVFEGNGLTVDTLQSIDALLPLAAGYPDYVAWALATYGTPSVSDSDGELSVEADGSLTVQKHYDSSGAYIMGGGQSTRIAPDPQSDVAVAQLSYTASNTAYSATLYKLMPRNSAPKRKLHISFSGNSSDVPFVLALAKDKTVVLRRSVANCQSADVRNFGPGATNQVATVYLVHVTTATPSPTPCAWTVEAAPQPPGTDVALALPAHGDDVSEQRTYTPGTLVMPNITVDASAETAATSYGIMVWGVAAQPAPHALDGWFALGIPTSESQIVYGDPSLGTVNSASPASVGASAVAAPSLDTMAQINMSVWGCDDTDCSSVGTRYVRYVDGDVTFTYSITPAAFTPAHDGPTGTVPATPVSIALQLANGSSLPIVVNSLALWMQASYSVITNPLRPAGTSPLAVVAPGTSASLSFSNVRLQVDESLWGSVQTPRLSIEFDNPVGFAPDSPSYLEAFFWAETFSEPAQLSILAP